jgi:hypothetical protein
LQHAERGYSSGEAPEATHLEYLWQPLPEDAIFPRTDDRRPLPSGMHGQYRPLREIAADKGLHIIPLGKRSCLLTRSPRLHAYIVPPGKKLCVGGSQLGLRGRSLEAPRPVISSCPGSHIVFYGKFPTLILSSHRGTDIVLARKRCRPARERTSSYPGTHIVSSGNLYRLAGEKLSFRLGNARSFSLQTCLFFSARGSGAL